MRGFAFALVVPILFSSLVLSQNPQAEVERLNHPDPRLRQLAAEAIGKQEIESAIPELAKLLRDPDRGVRGAAAGALSRIGPKSVPALVSALSYPDEVSRVAALEALRSLASSARVAPSKETLASLATALKDKSIDVRIHAAAVLGAFGADAKPILPALVEAAKDTANLGEMLRPNLPSSVTESAIAAALKIDPNGGEEIAKAALPSLIVALKSKDRGTVQAAAYAVGKLGPNARTALPALREAQKNARGFAETAVTSALTAIEGDGANHSLFLLINDQKAPATDRLRALQRIKYTPKLHTEAIAILIEATKDKDPRIRAAAVETIRIIGHKAIAAIPSLLDLLGDQELEKAARQAAIQADDLIPAVLAAMGSEAVPGLAKALMDGSKRPFARFQAAEALSKLGRKSRSALPALEAGMRDSMLPIAIESSCAFVLAGGDQTGALPLLREGLRHKSGFTIWTSLRATERLGIRAKDTVPDLIPLLGRREKEIRIGACHALAKMGPSAGPAVVKLGELLRDKDPGIRYHAASALDELGNDAKDALPLMVERLQDPDQLSTDPILKTLVKLGPEAKPALPTLLRLLDSGKAVYCYAVIDAIGQIGPDAKSAVPELMARLEKPSEHDRRTAARALGRIGSEASAAVPQLKKLLGDEKKMVRVWAAFALARITRDFGPQIAYLIEMWNEEREDQSRISGSVRFDIAHAFELLGAEARPARDILLAALLDEQTFPGTHDHVARALAQFGEDADVVVPKFIELLERKPISFRGVLSRKTAVTALATLGPKARMAIPALRRLLDDEDETIVQAAAKALEKIETPAKK